MIFALGMEERGGGSGVTGSPRSEIGMVGLRGLWFLLGEGGEAPVVYRLGCRDLAHNGSRRGIGKRMSS